MDSVQSDIGTSVTEASSSFEANMICCYLEAGGWSSCLVLSREHLLAAQALQLLMSLDRVLREARADWNQDRFRRVMKARSKAVSRVRRRWDYLNPAPPIALGKLRRRFHANLAGYLYEPRKSDHMDWENEDKTLAGV